MPDVHVLPTLEDAARAAVEFIVRVEAESLGGHGEFSIALSGGATPQALYELMASPLYSGKLNWPRWSVFWGDERCVPPDHPESNYRMAKEALLGRVPVDPARVHRILAEASPESAATYCERRLHRAFHRCVEPTVCILPIPSFDLVLLGLGEDGHAASLFPGSPALAEKTRLAVATQGPSGGGRRITFTLPLINAARHVAFVVTGAAKAEAARRVLRPKPGEPVPPAALVRPHRGTVDWFLDAAAGSALR